MLRPRVIPCLLIHQGGLVKTVQFRKPKYVGDPINAVKIFNEKEADELMVMDIDVTVNGSEPDYKTIGNLAAECRMPLAYGGGVRSAEQAKRIISLGVEKVAISAAALEQPELIARTAEAVGSQSVVVVIDVRKTLLGGYSVVSHNAGRTSSRQPVTWAQEAETLGAGEIVINSVDRDGTMKGYDLALAVQMRDAVSVPLTFLGGAGSLADIEQLMASCGTVGAAAGSLFVFKGAYRAVLISYPTHVQKESFFSAAQRALR
jgi:imidazole glycerol-phosphate synthase subunit HisF